MGATSGIGLEVAKLCIREGWQIGAAGRNVKALETLQSTAPKQVVFEPIDVTREDAPEHLTSLIEKLGGMDIYLYCSGIGFSHFIDDAAPEIATVETNGVGFTRMVTAAFLYFRRQNGGHLAVISSVAGTKGMAATPAYSATKALQSRYIDALSQLAHNEKLPIRFTDIRPGFVATPLLNPLNANARYPMLMQPEKVAARILKAIKHRRRRIVIDRRWAFLVFLWKLIPEWIWERIKIY